MELDYSLDPENGFEKLFDSIGANSKREMMQAEISVYGKAEDVLQSGKYDSNTEKYFDHPQNMAALGNAIASHYAGLLDGFKQDSMIDDEFYRLDIEERLLTVEELVEEKFGQGINSLTEILE